jgi:hypothetical protein
MDSVATLRVYKDLADWYERQGQPAMRDRFLILAAEAAFSSGKPEEAERMRQRLLQGNPHHMLKPFSSFAQALQSSNVQIYIHDLQMNYPPETAEGLLQKLRGGSEQTTTLPQTAPLIEIRDEQTLPLENTVEALKVYPLRDEPPATAPPAPPVNPTHLNRPTRPKQAATPPAVPAPARPSTLSPSASRPQPAKPRQPVPSRPPRPAVVPEPSPPPAHLESAAPGGAWLTLLLFGMTVTAGGVLAVYTLARPFLPASWLP